MAKAAKKHKLDIQKVLKALDLRDRNFFRNLTEEEKKQVPFPVIRRWMSTVGTVDFSEGKRQGRRKGDGKGAWPIGDEQYTGYYLEMTNEVANEGFMMLYEHPELQWNLLTTIGCGQAKQHQWLPANKKVNATKIGAIFQEQHPLASEDEISMLIEICTKETFEDQLKDLGYQDDQIKVLMKQFKEVKKANGQKA